MASLESPIVPSRLHRYRSLTRSATAIDEEIDSIVKRYIYCANFSKMNDPMEGLYRSSKLLKGHLKYKQITKAITDKKSDIGIACFSESNDSVLMWAHYAGTYSGFCISYSGSALLSGLAEQVKMVRLAYVDEPPLLFPSHAENAESAAVRVLSQKKNDWAYEREWRILAKEGRARIDHIRAIKRITFGLHTSTEHREQITAAIKGTDIELHEMQVDEYGLTSEPVRTRRTSTQVKGKKTTIKYKSA